MPMMTEAAFGGNDLLAHCCHMHVWTFHPSESDPLSTAWEFWAVSSEMEMWFPLANKIFTQFLCDQ